jgi:hypothetical protein
VSRPLWSSVLLFNKFNGIGLRAVREVFIVGSVSAPVDKVGLMLTALVLVTILDLAKSS